MSRPLFGVLAILVSTIMFAGATVVSKYAATTWQLNAAYVTMSRFVLGFLMVLPGIVREPHLLHPVSSFWVVLRAVTNVAAVLLFFFGIQYTTVSKANLLNMTYPVFVFAVAPLLIGERAPRVMVLFLGLTLVGVWNVVRPDDLTAFDQIVRGDLLAFSSAIVVGFAISALRQARKTDASQTILFYIMAVGVVANLAFLPFVPPAPAAAIPAALIGGALGALGQLGLTVGFRHVSAATGSLLSTARIPIAWTLGIVIFGDPLTLRSLLGTILILSALSGAAWYQRRLAVRE